MGEQGLVASLGGAVPVIGLGIQALGMGASIIQGINANQQKREAERAAEAALNEAKKRLSVNRLEGVQIPLSAYNEAFKTGVAQQQQSLAALSESDPRALAAGVGKVQAASAEQDERTRQAMEQAVYNRDVMVANAQQKIDENLAGISLEEAKGAQQAAMQAEQQAASAFSGALGAAGNIGQNIYENSALYGNNNKLSFDSGMNSQQYNQAVKDLGMSGAMNRRARTGEYIPFSVGQIQPIGLQMPQSGLIQLPPIKTQ